MYLIQQISFLEPVHLKSHAIVLNQHQKIRRSKLSDDGIITIEGAKELK